jgi:hypothetical protein
MPKKELKEWLKGSDQVDILKREITRQRRELIKAKTREASILEAVDEALSEPIRVYVPQRPKRGRARQIESAVVHLSDIQIGKLTESYDIAVARERIETIFLEKIRRITEARRSAASIDACHVYLGGDIVEGEDIFPGQSHEIEQGVFDQAIKTSPEIISNLILGLLETFHTVRVVSVPGNHGRNGRFGRGQHPRTNWDNVVYQVVRRILPTSDRLAWNLSESFYAVDDVLGWGNLIVHGDQIRGGLNGFPYYGVGKKAWGWIDSVDKRWDYLWFGHFHTFAMGNLNRRIWLANGTTESDNTYAQEQMAACGDPCQRLAFFNAEHGLIADHQVFLTKSRRRAR